MHYYQIYWGLAILTVLSFYCKSLFKYFHVSFAIAATYTVFQTYLFGFWIDNFEPYSAPLNMVLKIHHEEALVMLLLALFLLKEIKIKPKWLGWLCVTNILVTLILLPVHVEKFHMIGLSMNPAMNAAITSITMPFLFSLPSPFIMPFLSLGAILILATKNVTPVLALIAAFFGPAFFVSRHKARNLSLMLLAAVVLFALIHNHSNVKDRIENWNLFGTYWKAHFPWFIGSGNGSFIDWGPLIQKNAVFSDEMFFNKFMPFFDKTWESYNARPHWYWLWLHSDIYQTLFELGAIGLILWANAIIRALYRVRRNEPVIAGMLSWLVVAAFYYPLHFPIQLGLGLALLTVAIKKEV